MRRIRILPYKNEERRFRFRVLTLVAFCVLSVGVGWTQDDPGEPGVITGVVVGGAGRPMPEVRVHVRERGAPASGALHHVVTERDGAFRFDGLRLGVFDVYVSDNRAESFLTKPAKVVRLTRKQPERKVTIRIGERG